MNVKSKVHYLVVSSLVRARNLSKHWIFFIGKSLNNKNLLQIGKAIKIGYDGKWANNKI